MGRLQGPTLQFSRGITVLAVIGSFFLFSVKFVYMLKVYEK